MTLYNIADFKMKRNLYRELSPHLVGGYNSDFVGAYQIEQYKDHLYLRIEGMEDFHTFLIRSTPVQ